MLNILLIALAISFHPSLALEAEDDIAAIAKYNSKLIQSERRPSFWTKSDINKKNKLKKEDRTPATQVETATLPPESATILPEGRTATISPIMATNATGERPPAKVPRSYPYEDHHSWDEKEPMYHSSSYSTYDVEPSAYHHHYLPHPSYYHESKENTLFTKVALFALIKLLIAKIKAIGLIKIVVFVLLKIPIIFFKLLFFFKGLKFLKILSLPFFLLGFALPLIPLLLLGLGPLALLPLLLFPVLLPLIPLLLLFLPIIPVTTPTTAPTAAGTVRLKRSLLNQYGVDSNGTSWSLMDEKWMNYQLKKKNKSSKKSSSYQTLSTPQDDNILWLTRKALQTGGCWERMACEFAVLNELEMYQDSITWALKKFKSYAPEEGQPSLDKYTEAYEHGMTNRTCADRYHCTKPKFFMMQGQDIHKIF